MLKDHIPCITCRHYQSCGESIFILIMMLHPLFFFESFDFKYLLILMLVSGASWLGLVNNLFVIMETESIKEAIASVR